MKKIVKGCLVNGRCAITKLHKQLLLLIFISTILLSGGCGNKSELNEQVVGKKPTINILDAGNAVCNSVGTVTQNSAQPQVNAGVIILPEQHNSRLAQLQEAVALVRLHDKYQLHDIALEGYVQGKQIDYSWIPKTFGHMTVQDRAIVVVQILKEGEISAAEFMRLVYDDITIHPIEDSASYYTDPPTNSSVAIYGYLVQIALKQAESLDTDKQLEIMERFNQIKNENNKVKKIDLQKKAIEYLIAQDNWTKQKYEKLLTDSAKISDQIEEQIAELQDIKNKSSELGLTIKAEDSQALDGYIDFLSKRKISSEVMVDATDIMLNGNKSIAAMIIGAAHTKGICDLFDAKARAYCVIEPLALNDRNNPSNLSSQAFNLKYQQKSVVTDGIMKEIFDHYGVKSLKKPEQVIDQPWFKAKIEVYTAIARIARIAGNGNYPPFPPELLKGNYYTIDPDKIMVRKKERDIIIPIVLINDDDQQKTVWCKAKTHAVNASFIVNEQGSVEEIVKQAMSDVLSETNSKSKISSNNKTGIISVAYDVRAVLGNNKNDVIMLKDNE
jgi:hypothetical protein